MWVEFECVPSLEGSNNNGDGGNSLAKAVPMSTLVNDDVENLWDGGVNNNSNAYNRLYSGAAGVGAVGGNVGSKDMPRPADV